MCRIAGIIGTDRSTISQDIGLMTNAMHRGGPDDAGFYIDDNFPLAFGHRRLSIIDLSDAGHQPMHNVNDTLVICFNGEIYNYLSLREQLIAKGHIFKSHSDTEVILNGYSEWGIAALLEKLNGMFAFLLFDKTAKKLIAARDSAGIKPLYYSQYAGKLYFSSEIRGFKAVNPNWPENPYWGVWFLSFGFLPEPNTTLNQVSHLPKGHYLEYFFDNESYAIHPFYQDEFKIEITNREEAIRLTKETITKAIEDHLIADVPVGVFLSGGLDSSIITTVAQKKHKEKLNSLSIYFEDEQYSEKHYQDLVMKRTGVIHRSFKVTNEEYQAELPNILEAMDQPSIDGVNTYFISKYARETGLKVVLSGLGADELFGGYSTFDNKVEKLRKVRLAAGVISAVYGKYPLKKVSYLEQDRWYNSYLLNRGLFTPSDTAKITGFTKEKVNSILDCYPEQKIYTNLEKQNKVSFLETSIYMQNQLLRDSDVYSMWHGLELRVPFLDKNVIQLARSIEPSIKYNASQKKYLMVAAFKNDLPREVWDRKKQGFGFPFEKWFNNNKYLNNAALLPENWRKDFVKNRITFSRAWAIFLQRSFSQNLQLELDYPDRVPKTLFTYLCAFSATGGIEKVNGNILKTISDKDSSRELSEAISLHDSSIDTRYFNRYRFKGFGGRNYSYIKHFLTCNLPWEHVIVGHINLLPVAWILKERKPSIKISVLAHGIEVWKTLSQFNKGILKNADKIISVSEYTKQKLIELNGICAEKIVVKPNCLDPFFLKNEQFNKPTYLLRKYGLTGGEKIVLSVSRISFNDRYKGYDRVLQSIADLKSRIPNVLYLICGKATEDENAYLEDLVEKLGVRENVRMVGFVKDDELQDHYMLADVFALPSKEEGFGIVFIEAAACGVPVIAGNEDASKEALLNGEIGTLVNPEDIHAISVAIEKAIINPQQKNVLQEKVWNVYDFSKYKNGSVF
jgi:asparagine synthase (glutamine-hydrolysing)